MAVGPDDDQRVAGGMAWVFGGISTMIVVLAIAVQWALGRRHRSQRSHA
ncbi:hypothetical protein [Nonomuraea typhae]|nr:hypothetical protein [Nonomuraea typhae]